jgi:hypothetical protein
MLPHHTRFGSIEISSVLALLYPVQEYLKCIIKISESLEAHDVILKLIKN